MNQNLNYYISLFFKDYLPNLLGVSNNTILSYRDSLVLLLNYLKEVQNININNLKLDTINSDLIEYYFFYFSKSMVGKSFKVHGTLASIREMKQYFVSISITKT